MEDEEDESAKIFRQAKVNFENCEDKEAQALYQKAICINNETGNKSRQ